MRDKLFLESDIPALEVEVFRTKPCPTASLERGSQSPWEQWSRQPIRNATRPNKETVRVEVIRRRIKLWQK